MPGILKDSEIGSASPKEGAIIDGDVSEIKPYPPVIPVPKDTSGNGTFANCGS